MVISRTSQGWNELEFGVICDVQNGYAFKSENFISHGIPIIKIANIQDGRVIIDETSSYPEINISDSFFVNTGDILLAMSGATTGKVGVYTGKRRLYLNQRVCKMVCKDASKTYYPYVKYLLSSNLFLKQLESSLTAGAQPNLSPKQVSKMIFKIPSYEEQKAIASALSDVDELIANLEKLIEKKKSIKQGTTQMLLTGKIRLPGFIELWKEEIFGNLCIICRGGSPRPIQAYLTNHNDGINWIKIGDVRPNAKYITSTQEKIIEAGASRSRRVYSGDFILSNSMSFGRPYILKLDGCIHDGWLAIQEYQKSFDTNFLYYMLGADYIFEQYIQMAAGSSVQNLNKEKVSQLIVRVPSIEEQKAIAHILSDMDSEIDNLEKKLEKYRMVKQGMMQKLLTGEIRLV